MFVYFSRKSAWLHLNRGLITLDTVHSRASERVQDQIIEEIKEKEHTKTEEALRLMRKEHDLWMYQNDKEEAKRLQGATKKHVKMARLSRGEKDGRKLVEAGA